MACRLRGRFIFARLEIRFLPSGQNKKSIYHLYQIKWSSLVDAPLHLTDENGEAEEHLKAPLPYTAFLKVWKRHLSVLRISAGGTDYCDTRIMLNSALKIC